MGIFRVKSNATRSFSVGGTYRALSWRPVMLLCMCAMLLGTPVPLLAEPDLDENMTISFSSRTADGSNVSDEERERATVAMTDFLVSVSGPVKKNSPHTVFALVDVIPEYLSFFVGDLEQSGSGPVAFNDIDSGLEFSFDGLASATDSIEFSNDGGETFDYVPVADETGFDQNVTHIKLRPRGVLLPTYGKYERFSLRYRMKVR